MNMVPTAPVSSSIASRLEVERGSEEVLAAATCAGCLLGLLVPKGAEHRDHAHDCLEANAGLACGLFSVFSMLSSKWPT